MLFDESKIKEAIASRAREVKITGKLDSSLVSSYVSKACRELNIDPSALSISTRYKGGLLLSETIIYFTYSSNRTINPEPQVQNEIKPERSQNNNQTNQTVSDDYLVLQDNGQTSFLNQLKLSSGHYKFEIHTRDPRSIVHIIQNERYKLLQAEEGINNFKAQSKGGVQMFNVSFSFGGGNKDEVILFEYDLGMPLTQFLDHRRKGIEKASSIYTQLTHSAKFPADILAFLAFCWLQKNVHYNYDYLNRLNRTHKPENDNHMSYGPLVRKLAVCEGYAWGLIHIMEKGGFIAKLACGARKEGAHAWARVLVNGKWYNVDPTITFNGPGYYINNLLVSDNYLLKQGYKIDPHPDTECYDTKYDNQRGIVQAISKRKDELIRLGANKEILNGPFMVGN